MLQLALLGLSVRLRCLDVKMALKAKLQYVATSIIEQHCLTVLQVHAQGITDTRGQTGFQHRKSLDPGRKSTIYHYTKQMTDAICFYEKKPADRSETSSPA